MNQCILYSGTFVHSTLCGSHCLYYSELNLLGSKLITYKKEKTGRVACSQPGVTRLLGRLLRVAVRGVCSFVFSDTGHYTKLDGINVDSRRATLGRS